MRKKKYKCKGMTISAPCVWSPLTAQDPSASPLPVDTPITLTVSASWRDLSVLFAGKRDQTRVEKMGDSFKRDLITKDQIQRIRITLNTVRWDRINQREKSIREKI